MVCALLEKHCRSYVDPSFTAMMEERLDMIARGEEGAERITFLDEFYAGGSGLEAKVQYIMEEVEADDARRVRIPSLAVEQETEEDVALLIGPWGPYVQKYSNGEKVSSALPSGLAADIGLITPHSLSAVLNAESQDDVLGKHPDDGRNIRLKVGRYGAYLQWGEPGEEDTTNHSLPKHIGSMRNIDYDAVADGNASLGSLIGLSFDEAVGYVNLPRTVTTLHDLPIAAAIGPYGPYLKYNNTSLSLGRSNVDVLSLDAETAKQLVTEGIIENTSKSE